MSFETIKNRIVKSGAPYTANDNIAPFLHDGDIDTIQAEIAKHMAGVLDALIIDTEHDHNTKDTANRVAKMLVREVFSGRYEPAPKTTDFPNAKRLGDIMVVGPIDVRSTCSHHFAPILGKAWIGIVPGERVLGVSKFSRLFRWFASRPQIQEELTVQVADYLEEKIQPKGLAIVIKARHTCMTWRGVKDTQTKMTTSVMRGVFMSNSDARKEFLGMIGG